MATIKQLLATKANITITSLASLVNTAACQAAAIDNSTNLYMDVLVAGFITLASTGVGANGWINVYKAGSLDGGTTYSGKASGSDAAHTLTGNEQFLGRIDANVNAEVSEFGPWSLIDGIWRTLPERWTIIVENQSGAALAASGHEVHYMGVHFQQ